MGTKEFMEMAANAEKMCSDEVRQVLEKYNCSIHYSESYVDGHKLPDGGIFFKFRPEMLMNQRPANTETRS